MARKLIEVQTLRGYTIEELMWIAKFIKSYYLKLLIRAVVMRYQGVHTNDIAVFLDISPKTVIRYINTWNKSHIESATDTAGDIVSISIDGKSYIIRKTRLNKAIGGYEPGIAALHKTCMAQKDNKLYNLLS